MRRLTGLLKSRQLTMTSTISRTARRSASSNASEPNSWPKEKSKPRKIEKSRPFLYLSCNFPTYFSENISSWNFVPSRLSVLVYCTLNFKSRNRMIVLKPCSNFRALYESRNFGTERKRMSKMFAKNWSIVLYCLWCF